MIDSQPGNPAFIYQLKDQAVSRGEHFRLFYVEGDQAGNVEEAPVIDLLASDPPKRQYIGLLTQQIIEEIEAPPPTGSTATTPPGCSAWPTGWRCRWSGPG